MASITRYAAASAALGAGGVALGSMGIPAVSLIFGAAAAPAILGAGGVALPAAWWLLQSIPRHPKLVNFPFIRLLFNKVAPDKQVRDAPLWQKIVGTSAVAAAFLAMAQPQFDSSPVVASGNGPVMIVVDNSWDSAKDWPLMRRQIAQVIESAGRQGRSVMMLPTAAENPQGITVGEAQSAEDALRGLAALQPYPWPADRASAMKALEDMEGKTDGASVVWFTSGQADDSCKGIRSPA
ncbi:MAG: VWA domain-containing protein [Alphaproteobacteria bacterium]|nr:VWA domain-containing protein [Alphaproteobacteria bacterium]